MEKKEKLFTEKIIDEWTAFRESIFLLRKEEIFDLSKKIEVYRKIYCALHLNMDIIDEEKLPKERILDYLYEDYEDTDYSLSSDDLRDFLLDSMEHYINYKNFIEENDTNDIEM